MSKEYEPEVMINAILLELVERQKSVENKLEEVIELVKEGTPKGEVEPIIVVVGTTELVIDKSNYITEPLFSMSIINRGPNTVYYRLNNSQKEDEIMVNEVDNIDLKRAKIEVIRLYTKSGTSTVKIIGVR